MLPRNWRRLADSKSNSSARLPRTTTTRVSSGWVASISILLAIDESLFANPAPVRSRLRRRLRSAATGPRRRGGRGGGRDEGEPGRRHAPRKSLPGGVRSNPSSWICAYLNPKRDNGPWRLPFEPTGPPGNRPRDSGHPCERHPLRPARGRASRAHWEALGTAGRLQRGRCKSRRACRMPEYGNTGTRNREQFLLKGGHPGWQGRDDG